MHTRFGLFHTDVETVVTTHGQSVRQIIEARRSLLHVMLDSWLTIKSPESCEYDIASQEAERSLNALSCAPYANVTDTQYLSVPTCHMHYSGFSLFRVTNLILTPKLHK